MTTSTTPIKMKCPIGTMFEFLLDRQWNELQEEITNDIGVDAYFSRGKTSPRKMFDTQFFYIKTNDLTQIDEISKSIDFWFDFRNNEPVMQAIGAKMGIDFVQTKSEACWVVELTDNGVFETN